VTSAEIRTEYGAHGEILHLVPFAPPGLPPVTRRHLEQAWDAARAAAIAARAARIHGFRFTAGDTPPVELLLADRDAASWTSGVERIADLSTAYGISLCLRLLALVTLMGSVEWAKPWFSVQRAGTRIHPALLQAAALAPLTPTGGFAETSLQALLPHGTLNASPGVGMG
jgi:hypothetical protein